MSKDELSKEETEIITELVWNVAIKGRTVKIIASLQEKFPDVEGRYDKPQQNS